jgi:hypothetical protein
MVGARAAGRAALPNEGGGAGRRHAGGATPAREGPGQLHRSGEADHEDGNGFEQSYNAQASVDEANQIIVAVGVTNCAADNAQLIPMVEATEATAGQLPQQVLADAGYRSEAHFEQAESKNIDALVALGREGKADTAPVSPSNPATQLLRKVPRRQHSKRHILFDLPPDPSR